MLCNSDEDLGKEAAYIEIALAEQMAGVIIAVASDEESQLDALLDRGVPVVAVDRRPLHRGDDVDSVVVDNVLGARSPPSTSSKKVRSASPASPAHRGSAPRSDRLVGYREALENRGRPVDRDARAPRRLPTGGRLRSRPSLLRPPTRRTPSSSPTT